MRGSFTKLLLLFALASMAMAQQATPSTVLVSITDKAGYPPEEELRERLQVTADKQLAKVVSVEPAGDLQVHIAVLIDKSGRPSIVSASEQAAATGFLNRFARPNVDHPFMM